MNATREYQVVLEVREALSRVREAEEELYESRQALILAADHLREANRGPGDPMISHLQSEERYPYGDWQARRDRTDTRFQEWLDWDFDCWEGWR